jgi:PAS domain S-box-containing protein
MGKVAGYKRLSLNEEFSLIHDLQVHQIELEAQNEELRRSHNVLIAQKKHIQDLYAQSPIGYLSLNDQFLILDTNNTIHTFLGRDRGELLQQSLTRFILPEDQDLFYLFRKRLIETKNSENLDLRMLRVDGSPIWVSLNVNCIQSYDDDGIQFFRATINDISDIKQIEETLLFLAHHIPGESFFTELTRYLAQALSIEFVCIDMIETDGLSAQTLAVYHKGSCRDNLRYALKDTPCGKLVGKDVCCFSANVCQSFPQDNMLKELQAESYVGVTLWSSSGQAIGLISVISCQPLANSTRAATILKMVAVRAAGELERLAMTNDLRASEARYQRAVNGANEGIWEFIPATCETYLSPRWKQLLGYEDDELPRLQTSVFERLHPEDKSRGMEALREHLEKGTLYNVEYRLRCKDGEYRWFSSRGQAERDEHGQPLRMTGFLSDITERKEAEQALRKQYETYQDILTTTLDGFWLVDFQGNILDVNDSYCRQSGYSRQELLTMHPFDLDVTENESDTADHIQRMLGGDCLSRFETIHRRKDGSTWNVENSVGVSNQAGGQFVVFLRNITKRKKNEEMLAHSLQEKDVLLQEIHHRVKNNLQVVHSMLSLQARRIADSDSRMLFAASMNRVYTMSMIHERLCHAKDLASIDFNAYLKLLVDAILTTYSSPGITCVVETEPVFLDLTTATPCGLIIHELVTNSITHAFSEGQEGIIRVGLHKHSPEFMVLTVEDNGIGYQPDLQAGSSSLGLEIVKGLTAQIHGTLEASTVDGSRTSITFPGKFSRNDGVNL